MSLVVYDPNSLSAKLHQEKRHIRLGGIIRKDFVFHQDGAGTGSLLWPASELLSKYLSQSSVTKLDCWLSERYCDNNIIEREIPSWSHDIGAWRRQFWSAMSVLELGAGLGLLASTLLHLGVGSIFSTDGEESVVNQMEKNICMNCQENDRRLLHSCSCQVLRWGEISQLSALPPFTDCGQQHKKDQKYNMGVDFIIATDVVYGDRREDWRSLSLTLSMACRQRKIYSSCNGPGKTVQHELHTQSYKPQTVVLIAQTRRYPELEKEFYCMLEEEYGFNWLFSVDISGAVDSLCHSEYDKIETSVETVLHAYVLSE